MAFFVFLFLCLGTVEFFLVTRTGMWRFSGIVLPAAAVFFWMERQNYWAALETSAQEELGYALEVILLGTWAAAVVVGAIAGFIWNWRKDKKK